jgi:16S rRNA (guanine527-N7)-methyltransferase
LEGARVVDVGSGAGLPVIPCLIMRPDLRATLIEANTKKAVFLREALRLIKAEARATVVAGRFEETTAPAADFVMCRALERFTEKLREIIAWSPPASTLLMFGGPTIQEQIEDAGLSYQAVLMPASEQRFLFVIKQSG